MKLNNVFNIPLSCSFWDTLAHLYLEKYSSDSFKLSDVLFLLPNRRACQALTNAFIRCQGMKPTILPQICPIAELDDDEVFFSSFNHAQDMFHEESTISREERLFLFTRLIMSKPNVYGVKKMSLAQAVSLATDLANLIDTAYNQGLSFDKLDDLVPDKYSTHWQETLKLLKIITEYWPQILADRQAIDVCDLKNKLLFQQAKIWKQENTDKNIVIAGITANFPSIVEMVKCVMSLPNGEVYFAGIDMNTDDEYWQAVDESHPQFELKSLLELLDIQRKDVSLVCPPKNPTRELFISEIMRPAIVSDKWRHLKQDDTLQNCTENISLVECNTQRDEAVAIAIQMREILNHPEKTGALITYDRNLARRVAAELTRFGIKIDDSAGLPLHLSPIGIFMCLLIEAAQNIESELQLVTLLKNPFMLFGHSAKETRPNAYAYEMYLRTGKKDILSADLVNFAENIKKKLSEFNTLLCQEDISFTTLISAHIKLAELFAASDEVSGKQMLWRGDAGKVAAKFFTKLIESAPVLNTINGREYLSLIRELMSLETVRTSYGTHPRLSILGPIEAHLHHFDYVILGEVNEGVWPKPAQADMWMSRPMKKDFGFSQPEKAIGILGFGLMGFLASDNVFITRAERVDGAPMKKSRWLLRMETVMEALLLNIDFLKINDLFCLANELDKPTKNKIISAPNPCPPVEARPRKLSASGVDLLINDPYAAYAKYILHLYPLDDLDKQLGSMDFGNLVHAVLEEFNNQYPTDFPENSQEILLKIGEKHFAKANIPSDIKSFWIPKFQKMIEWVCEEELTYRIGVERVHNEVNGQYVYHLPQGDFTLTAKADRVDELKNGNISVIDYKTGGTIPSVAKVASGHALQLPIEGLIASKGKFEQIENAEIEELNYWQLAVKKEELLDKHEDLILKCEDYLKKLFATYDLPETGYCSRPNPKYVSANKDYDHLARIKEWSVQENEDSYDD